MSQKLKFFIASGGTGGHIIPARCLAEELSKEDCDVVFLGDIKCKNYILESDVFKSQIISSSQFRKSPIALSKAVLKIGIGILQCLYLFLKIRPKCLIAFGGYSTFPALIAAILTKTKIILHEQNSHLGKVNRIFARYSKKIALSFSKTSGIDEAYSAKTSFTGNLVRKEILSLSEKEYRLPMVEKEVFESGNKMGYDVLLASDFCFENVQKTPNLFKILVIGGSGGAKIFSEILPKAFFNLAEDLKRSIEITQQCRQELIESTFGQYKNFNINISLSPFFANMPELIESSHLIIARSGSSSIFEFCAAKKPMILVPFAAAADNHQEKNARYLEENGAAIVVTEQEFTIQKLSELLRSLINNHVVLERMSRNAASLAILNAAENLIRLIKDSSD